MSNGQGETETSASRTLGMPIGQHRNLGQAIRWLEVRASRDTGQPRETFETISTAALYSEASEFRDNLLLTPDWHSVYIVACDVISWKDRTP